MKIETNNCKNQTLNNSRMAVRINKTPNQMSSASFKDKPIQTQMSKVMPKLLLKMAGNFNKAKKMTRKLISSKIQLKA